jgi:linoleoyl-CoA desaturase
MDTAAPRPAFRPPGAFQVALKREVAEHFRRNGRATRGGPAMGAKVVAMFAWLLASYLPLLLLPLPWWAVALLTASVGLAIAGIGFNVMHDANHGSLSARPWVNHALSWSLDLIGGSSWLWRHKHNVLHHTWPNVAGLDTDGDAGPALRLAPQQRRRVFHRFQHLYAWALYGVFALKWWFFDDLHELITGRIVGHPYPRPRGAALFGLLFGKALFLGWAFVLPALLHPTVWLLPVWLLGSASAGVVLAAVFQLAHCVGEVAHPEAGADDLEQPGWAELQVATTADFARGGRLLSWYLGGLNFQVEHHLFPGICHVHYRELAPIVERLCRVNGLAYQSQPTLRAALRANFRWLRFLGSGAPASAWAGAPGR